MNTSPNFSIIGTGAIGGFLGAKLHQAGFPVHFLVRSDYEHIKKNGIKIQSPNGNVSATNLHVYNTIDEIPACDVVLLTLMTTQNHLVKNKLARLLKPNGVLIIIQNGIGIEEEMAEIIGAERIVGATINIKVTKVDTGLIKQSGTFQIVTFAEFNKKEITPRIQLLAKYFEKAGFQTRTQENLAEIRWEKLLFNIPFNSLSVILNAYIHELVANPDSKQLISDVMSEAIAIANAYDCQLNASDKHVIFERVKNIKDLPSMKVDYDRKRPLELEAILGNPLRLAEQKQIAAPLIKMLYQQLRFLDERNLKNDGG